HPPMSSTALSCSDAPPPPELYTLPLHDALPIWRGHRGQSRAVARRHRRRAEEPGRRGAGLGLRRRPGRGARRVERGAGEDRRLRSEEHTSELQSHLNLVCRLLLEKKKSTA